MPDTPAHPSPAAERAATGTDAPGTPAAPGAKDAPGTPGAPAPDHDTAPALERPQAIPWFLPTPLEAILVVVFAATTWGIPSDDVWWHLACGRWFVENGRVPPVDPLSIVSAGTPWIAHYWLWDVVAYAIVRASGVGLLLWMKGVGAMLTVVLSVAIARRRGVRSVTATGVTLALAAAAAKSQFWNLRPQMMTPLGTGLLTLLCLQAVEGSLRWIWLAPVAMAVWVNCHGGFIFGLVTLGTFGLGQIVAYGRAEEGARQRLTLLLMVSAACVLACCLNPYGPRHLLYPFFYMGNTALQTRITEWAGTMVRSEPLLEVTIVALVALLAASRLPTTTAEIVQIAIALHFSFVSTRNFFLLGPWVAPVLGARVESLVTPAGTPPRPDTPLTSHRWHLALVLAALVVPYFLVRTQYPFEPDFTPPTRQIAALALLPSEVPVLNQYELGGLIMWDAWPRRPFIDGRSDLHIVSGGFVKFLHVWDLDPGWEKILFDEYHVGAALLDAGTPLARALALRGWTVKSREKGEKFELLVAPVVEKERSQAGRS